MSTKKSRNPYALHAMRRKHGIEASKRQVKSEPLEDDPCPQCGCSYGTIITKDKEYCIACYYIYN